LRGCNVQLAVWLFGSTLYLKFHAPAEALMRKYGVSFSRCLPAGISEGLLANCCGPLSESVRKQLFIVRTSGARLLALINDVMDAATLRQHRLVLKQERLELRQLVGDVVDLTRSLVSEASGWLAETEYWRGIGICCPD
jgi:signal transduction histidine kinase